MNKGVRDSSDLTILGFGRPEGRRVPPEMPFLPPPAIALLSETPLSNTTRMFDLHFQFSYLSRRSSSLRAPESVMSIVCAQRKLLLHSLRQQS